MKLWKRGVCCCLAFAILLAGLPLAILSAAQTTDKRYVIFDANPRNVSETDGADAYPSGADYEWNFGKDRIKGTGSINYEGEETPCYVLKFDTAFDHDKVLVENGFMCNNGGSNAIAGKISSGYMGWLQYPEILRAIKDYVYVSYDVYVEDPQGRDIILTVSPMHQYMDPWAKNPQSNCGVFDRFTVTEKNEWISRSVQINSIADAAETADRWTQGDVFFQVSGLDGAALTVKIRNFRLEIKESDHENINTALSEVANIDKKKNFTTYFWSENDPLPDLPKTAGGKNDYFAILAAFDGESEYSSNIITSSIVNACEDPNGSVSLSKTYEKSGNKVSIAVAPNDGYKFERLTIKDADGNNVAAKRTGINSFVFVMPTSKVTVSAVFTEDDNTDDINYVIWDANADRFIGKDDIIYTNPSESYLWFNKQTVGSVTAVDDDKSYYEIVFNKNGAVNGNGEGGTATIKSGAGAFSGVPWLSDQSIIKALLPYLAMSFEARRTDSGDANPQYKVGMAPVWAEYGDAQFGIIGKDDPLNSDRNNWHTYTFSNLDPDMGLDLSKIQYIQIRGIQEVNDDIYLSAFRFYSNLAPDEPDPVVEPEETVIYSFQIDEKLFKGTVDHKNLTLTLPYGTYLWELLAGLRFDALDMSVMVKDADGRSQTEDVILTADMTLTLMQDGYIVDEYKIIVIGAPADNHGNSISAGDSTPDDNETETETVVVKKKRLVKKAGSAVEDGFNVLPIVIAVCAVVTVAAVIIVVLFVKKKKTQNRSGL